MRGDDARRAMAMRCKCERWPWRNCTNILELCVFVCVCMCDVQLCGKGTDPVNLEAICLHTIRWESRGGVVERGRLSVKCLLFIHLNRDFVVCWGDWDFEEKKKLVCFLSNCDTRGTSEGALYCFDVILFF